jgi:hypothetical protein
MQLPKVYSTKVYNMLNNNQFLQELAQKFRVDKTHDVPYLAGYSKNDRVIYIDRHFPLNMNGTNIERYIVLHEKTEKALLDVFHLKYPQAHHIATHVEHMAIISDGISWVKYEAYCEKYIKKCADEKVKNPPKDLDLRPYKDEHDFKELENLINGTSFKPKKGNS